MGNLYIYLFFYKEHLLFALQDVCDLDLLFLTPNPFCILFCYSCTPVSII